MYDYDKQTWNNGVAGGTPLNADRLNHMEQGIDDLATDSRYMALAIDNTATLYPLALNAYGPWSTGLAVMVPPTDRVIEFEWSIPMFISAAGVGLLGTRLAETTTGASVDRGQANLAGTFTAGTYDSLPSLFGNIVVEPLAVPAWRTFKLEAGVFRASGALAASVQASQRKVYLKAIA